MTDSSKKRLAKNTLYLYVLSLSSQAISFLTIPYQTRILSPETFGVIGFVTAIMVVFLLCINYGFLYSATEKIALHADNKRDLRKIYTATTIAKVIICIPLVIVSIGLVLSIEILRHNAVLFALYFVANVLAGLVPDFLYRGLEQMKTITVRTVLVRLLSAVIIFVFLRTEKDVLVLPVSLIVGNAAALVVCYLYDRRVLSISFMRVSIKEVKEAFAKGLPFFFSRIASTVYQAGNSIVLGFFYPGQAQVGWFSAADKFMTVVKQISSPVADSIYPYMIKKKDFKLAIKVIVFSTPLILATCAVLFIFADSIAAFVFGEEYIAVGDVIRCLIPAMAVIFPTYIICFPILIPLGLSNYANASNIIGMVIQLLLVALLLCFGVLNVYTVCICASISEVAVFVFRLVVMIKHRGRMRGLFE